MREEQENVREQEPERGRATAHGGRQGTQFLWAAQAQVGHLGEGAMMRGKGWGSSEQPAMGVLTGPAQDADDVMC